MQETTTIKKRKPKLKTYHCPKCDKKVKMEVTKKGGKDEISWLKCRDCNYLIPIIPKKLKTDEMKDIFPDDLALKPEQKKYQMSNTYNVGDAIYHPFWKDVGLVIGKTKTSSGKPLILVSFSTLGEKKLVEDYKKS